ncbi:hypothetical protein Tco_0959946 [Tanacetum coccineum]
MGEGSTIPTDPQDTPTITQPSSSLPQKKQTPRKPLRKNTEVPQLWSGGGPRPQETMGDTIAQTGSENVSKYSNDPLLVGVNTPRSGEDSLKLEKLMELCTTLQSRVLALETTKTRRLREP